MNKTLYISMIVLICFAAAVLVGYIWCGLIAISQEEKENKIE